MGYYDYDISKALQRIATSFEKLTEKDNITYNVIVQQARGENIEETIEKVIQRLKNRDSDEQG